MRNWSWLIPKNSTVYCSYLLPEDHLNTLHCRFALMGYFVLLVRCIIPQNCLTKCYCFIPTIALENSIGHCPENLLGKLLSDSLPFIFCCVLYWISSFALVYYLVNYPCRSLRNNWSMLVCTGNYLCYLTPPLFCNGQSFRLVSVALSFLLGLCILCPSLVFWPRRVIYRIVCGGVAPKVQIFLGS